MSESILALLAAATILWFVGAYYLRGQDLSAFDAPERDYWPPAQDWTAGLLYLRDELVA